MASDKPGIGVQRKITVKEVASEAGVSAMTVSNVLNDRTQRVSPETREKVEAAIVRLGYRRDLSGLRLRLSRQFMVGMVVIDPSPTFVADAFTTSIVAGLSNYLSSKNYGLVLQGTTFDRLDRVGMLRNRQTDALCVMASGPPAQRREIYRRLASYQDPLVIFQDVVPEDVADAVSIRQDDAEGGRMLTRHLIDRGCRTFVWLTQRHPWPALETRLRAIEDALDASGVQTSLTVLASPSTDYASVQATLSDHMRRHALPDVFMGGNDQIGIAATNWLVDNGHSIPQDVWVTGFNAFDFWRYSRPTLTTIESRAYELGEIGGARLNERLERGVFGLRETVVPVGIRLGGST